MTVLLLAAAAVSGEEKVIANFKDVVLTPTKSKWSAETKSFRVFAKTAQKYRGKQVVFRMNAKRTAGDTGSKILFPELKKTYTVKAIQAQYGINTYWWTLAESVDTVREGIRPGMRFQVIPDWENAIVELVTTTEKVIAE